MRRALGRRGFLAGACGAALAYGCRGSGSESPEPDPSSIVPLNSLLGPPVERGEVPGLVAAVARDGKEQFEVLGVRTAGKSASVERDDLFRIASVTKPLTVVAAMILVEEGKLRLDEPVDRLLPELANRKVLKRFDSPLDDVVPAARAITVRDLFTFRMGFGLILSAPGAFPIQRANDELLGEGTPAPATLPPPDEWLKRLGTLPLMHQPGERWMYNTSAIVLGLLVGRAAGKPLEVFLRERVFDPLGMHDTDFSVPAPKVHRLTSSYLADYETGAISLYDPPEGQWSRPPAFANGADGLVSTAPDLLRFSALLLGGGSLGKTRILSPESVKLMTSDALTPANKAFGALEPGYFDTHGWGFGMAVVTATDDMHMRPGSYGWDGGLGSSWWTDPSTKTTGVLLMSRSWTDAAAPPLVREFWRTVNR